KLNLSGMEDTYQEFAQDNELNRVIGQLDNSIIELRRIARNMMPDTLLKLGLEMALKDLCEAYNTPKMEVSFQAMNIATDIPLSNQTNIYRIIQELISNAVKHAHAGRILVQCSQNGPLFLITIEDNGTGFDTAVLDTKKGLGWSNIKNRVAFLKGKLEIHSQASEGTTINIELNSYAG
ncbi:MAG TPA: ATP-binding protein, partial [Niabella sp.]